MCLCGDSVTNKQATLLFPLCTQPPPAFLPFLPKDNGSTEAEEILQLLNEDLSGLLKLEPEAFWEVVANDVSLPVCLDSYLRHRWCVLGFACSRRRPPSAPACRQTHS